MTNKAVTPLVQEAKEKGIDWIWNKSSELTQKVEIEIQKGIYMH